MLWFRPAFVIVANFMAIRCVRAIVVFPTLGRSVEFSPSKDMNTQLKNFLASEKNSLKAERIGRKTRKVRSKVVIHKKFTGNAEFAADAALDTGVVNASAVIEDPRLSFEGLRSRSNFKLLGVTLNPSDAYGDVGKDTYMQVTNVAAAVYNKHDGSLVGGPYPLGAFWHGFSIDGCTSSNSDPIVMYDQFDGRWIVTQPAFDCNDIGGTCHFCIAVSQTEDATGKYNRYAIPAQENAFIPGTSVFPDYPKVGVWRNHYIITSRDFIEGFEDDEFVFGSSVYAIHKRAMIKGKKRARYLHFALNQELAGVPEYMINENLLPPDVDGLTPPPKGTPAPIIGTVDDDLAYNDPWTPRDGINIWNLYVDWSDNSGRMEYAKMLPVAPYTSFFSCGDFNCIPQPGMRPNGYLDALSSFVMPRLAYRNFKKYEAMVLTQTVKVSDAGGKFGTFGTRWYEVRRGRRNNKSYSLKQEGTYAPKDKASRWIGSIAMDGDGNIALGYNVADAKSIFPGIRITGRLKNDPINRMTLGETTVVEGSDVQAVDGEGSWGDYASMAIDPYDDCTFWFTSQYISEKETRRCEKRGLHGFCWQTRIAAFKLPGSKCKKQDA